MCYYDSEQYDIVCDENDDVEKTDELSVSLQSQLLVSDDAAEKSDEASPKAVSFEEGDDSHNNDVAGWNQVEEQVDGSNKYLAAPILDPITVFDDSSDSDQDDCDDLCPSLFYINTHTEESSSGLEDIDDVQ